MVISGNIRVDMLGAVNRIMLAKQKSGPGRAGPQRMLAW